MSQLPSRPTVGHRGLRTISKSGWTVGIPFFRISPRGAALFSLHNVAKGDISGPSPSTMTVMSVDGAWQEPIAKDYLATWLQIGDILKTWLTLVISMDEVNKKIAVGQKSPAYCDFTVEAESSSTHPCSRCGNYTPCNMLATDPDANRACTSIWSIVGASTVSNSLPSSLSPVKPCGQSGP